jgi:hypothetical protein
MNAGIEEEYKNIIPTSEPEKLSIYPKSYKVTSFMFQ